MVAIVAVAGGWQAWKRGVLPPYVTSVLDGLSGNAGKMQRGEAINDVSGVGCFTGEDGEFLTFTDASGTENVVETPAQVPARYRESARCIHLVPTRR